MLAFNRSGRSFVTTTTRWASFARFLATARMRWSLFSPISAAGRPVASMWLISTRSVPPSGVIGIGRTSEPNCAAEVFEEAQAPPRGPSELGMLALRLELGDDDQGEDHLVLVEPEERAGIREEHGRVEHVGAGRRGLRR